MYIPIPRFPIEICQLIIGHIEDSIETTRTLASIPQLAPLFVNKLCFIVLEDETFTANQVSDSAMKNLEPYGNVFKFKVIHPLRCNNHNLPLIDGKCPATVGYGSNRICGQTYVSRVMYDFCLENDLESRKSIIHQCQRFSHVVFKTGMISNKFSKIDEHLSLLVSLLVHGSATNRPHNVFAFTERHPGTADLSKSWRILKCSIGIDGHLSPSVFSQSGHNPTDFFGEVNSGAYSSSSLATISNSATSSIYLSPRFGSSFLLTNERDAKSGSYKRNLIVDLASPGQTLLDLSTTHFNSIPVKVLRFIVHTRSSTDEKHPQIPYFITDEFSQVLETLNWNISERFLEAIEMFFSSKFKEEIEKNIPSSMTNGSFAPYTRSRVRDLIQSRITKGTSNSHKKILKFLIQYRDECQEYLSSSNRTNIQLDFKESLAYFHSQFDALDNVVYVLTLGPDLIKAKNDMYDSAMEAYGAQYVFDRLKHR
ncbi:hypothetical protein WICPIJ_007787 [Wickerhamomyces pijperi]|uniref:Uncharacterized protein n=1 Tax=Wickerhamomyces pijperi TaxID=599730 RepID=A0A9P8Q1R9_WICPI|nr:hypothetical protein WICPIJ_007787 [Wickerhamomyces pijperi]